LSATQDSAQRQETGPHGPVLFAFTAAIVVFAPLIRGGNRPLPMAALELAGLALLALLAWTRRALAARIPANLRLGCLL
jgi:hypothetical protein